MVAFNAKSAALVTRLGIQLRSQFRRLRLSPSPSREMPTGHENADQISAEAVSYRAEEQADFLLARRLQQLCPSG